MADLVRNAVADDAPWQDAKGNGYGAHAQPLSMELPISQVSTGKTTKDGGPTNKIKTWVTSDLARYVERVKSQGASRVSIVVTPTFD